jgi:uncharacterized protein YecE (DUF72 family)
VAGTLYVGTSGFSYAEWKGVFYPPEVKAKDFLSYYASRFRTVEINYTFRRQPSEKTIAGWAAQTPESFRFSLKGHQRVTHYRRLAGVEEEVSTFVRNVRPLGERLGPILYQCPPNLRFDRSLIEGFAGSLPSDASFAMEFRHPSWEEAKPILRDLGVGWCTSEVDEDAEPPEPVFEPFGYLRLRRAAYDDEQLKGWAERIGPALDGGRDVYVFVKHEDKDAGPVFARRILDLVQG